MARNKRKREPKVSYLIVIPFCGVLTLIIGLGPIEWIIGRNMVHDYARLIGLPLFFFFMFIFSKIYIVIRNLVLDYYEPWAEKKEQEKLEREANKTPEEKKRELLAKIRKTDTGRQIDL